MGKIVFIVLIFILSFRSVKGQDLIYTITGKAGETATSLDSILFENISNRTRILFSDLPARKDYMINLTQKVFWGTTVSALTEASGGFNIIQNQPGILALGCRYGTAARVTVSVYNMKGQMVYISPAVLISSFQSVNVTIGVSGVFLVRIASKSGNRSFKVTGQAGTGIIGIANRALTAGDYRLKDAAIGFSGEFSYQQGDSLRISVYKKSWYAYPGSLKINTSESVSFALISRLSDITGISNAFYDLSGKAVLVSYDTISGKAVFDCPGNLPGFKYGDIIVVENDTAGYLRKVVSSNETAGQTSVMTRQATMDEVFVNKEIKLSTKWMNPMVPLTAQSSSTEISEALTDKNGYSHPEKIIWFQENGKTIIKSPLQLSDTTGNSVPVVNILNSFLNSDIYGKDGESVHFQMNEGSVSLKADASFEFHFTGDGKMDTETKADKGDVKSFGFYMNNQAGVNSQLSVNTKNPIENGNTAGRVINAQKVSVRFLVEGVPVWITLFCNIIEDYHIKASGPVAASWGYKTGLSSFSGCTYNAVTDSFTPQASCEPENNATPIEAAGQSDVYTRFALYPRTEISFYNITGAYCETRPYVNAGYYTGSQNLVTSSGTEIFLAWNSGINLGSDLQTGARLGFLGLSDKNYDSGKTNCFEENLWKSPVTLALKTTLPSRSGPLSKIMLTFKVTDSAGNGVPGCTVFVEGKGTFGDPTIITGQNGEASCDWTLTGKTGNNDFAASIFAADKSVISSVKDTVEVYDSAAYGTMTCDGKIYKTKKFGSQIWMVENLAYLPAVSPPSSGSASQPYYYVHGYDGTDIFEAKKVAGYSAYGVLYNWYAATKGGTVSGSEKLQGVCPSGWHLPDDNDWAELWTYLVNNEYGYGGSGNRIAKAMASVNNWKGSNISGTPGYAPEENNSSEFNGLPGGYRCNDALAITGEGTFASWWTPAAYGADNAYHWGFLYNSSVLIKYYSNKGRGYFVRCVKNQDTSYNP